MKVIKSRGIELNTRDNLIKVDTKNRVATFQIIDSNQKPTGQLKEIKVKLTFELLIVKLCSMISCMSAHRARVLNRCAEHPQTETILRMQMAG